MVYKEVSSQEQIQRYKADTLDSGGCDDESFLKTHKGTSSLSYVTMSDRAQHALESLHENIACMRHPDHSGGEFPVVSLSRINTSRRAGVLLLSS